VEVYTADKAYDDGENHYNLEVRDLHSAIRLKKTRTEKKDDNKQVWLDLRQTPQYRQGLKECYNVERKFGEAKQGHGLGRCRYVGRMSFAVQEFFTAIILNLKRMVRLLAGIGFINPGDGLIKDGLAIELERMRKSTRYCPVLIETSPVSGSSTGFFEFFSAGSFYLLPFFNTLLFWIPSYFLCTIHTPNRMIPPPNNAARRSGSARMIHATNTATSGSMYSSTPTRAALITFSASYQAM
jgi:hypothetical protein